MTQNHIARRVALGLLLGSAAIPAAAQDVQSVTPPILTPAPPPVTTPEAAAPAPAPTASPSITFAPQSAVVQNVPPPPAPPPEATATEAPAATAPARRTARAPAPAATSRAARAAPQAAATPVAAPSPEAAPAEPLPAPVSAAPLPAPAAAPAVAPVPAPEAQPEELSSAAAWGMLAIPVIAILALAAWLLSRRRRSRAEAYDDTYYAPAEETVVEEPVIEAPLAAAPVAAADAAGRPWIDIGLRPVRAEDSLEVEVTVSNSGDAPAHDVKVSTWMLSGAESSDSEQALIETRSAADVATVDVAAGADESVDTRVVLPSDAGTPILVAEARYPLPMGGEGRIAATFEIDMTEGDAEARLHDVLERA
ncbi:hypothetical protein [Sphingomonas sp.]|uniref:hypothetical protein n=1 Tax=Sphingomonas sp. TaxID=28214 RepID=UPI002DBE65DF|nr:hypothetical protein [Sphingomonas sp.]HEU4969320.1 hypothetical protein [Sphingomonas sp.]